MLILVIFVLVVIILIFINILVLVLVLIFILVELVQLCVKLVLLDVNNAQDHYLLNAILVEM